MIRILIAILVFTTAAWAEEPRNPAIEGVIQGQFDAFSADDIEQAFTYASPTIKAIFGSHQRFGAMVENGFPMVRHHSGIKFLELRELGGRMWQKVLVTDAAGGLHVLDYQMVETEAGWQINAVQILPQPEIGA